MVANMMSFESHLNEQYGGIGTPVRNKFEEDFAAFKLETMVKENDLAKGQLADGLKDKKRNRI